MLLWLSSKELSGKMRTIVSGQLTKSGCKDARVFTFPISKYVPQVDDYKKPNSHSKGDLQSPEVRLKCWQVLRQFIKQFKPSVIVCNDEACLRAITGELLTLDKANGSLYWIDQTPFIGLADVRRLFTKDWFSFEMEEQFRKIARWANGTQRRIPAFRYEVCTSREKVEHHVRRAAKSEFLTIDIETIGTVMSCVGYSYLNGDGSVDSFVIPFVDQRRRDDGYCFWSMDDEVFARRAIGELNNTAVVKGFQNGIYDCVYFIRDNCAPKNYLLDSLGLQHSLYAEAKRDLASLACFYSDYYTYWKDDSKGEESDTVALAQDQYWKYNALDTYWNLIVIAEQLRAFRERPYAYKNYAMTLSLALGPCLAATTRGVLVDKARHRKVMNDQNFEAGKAVESLRALVGWDGFNPGSPNQRGWVLFEFFGAKKTRLQERKPYKYGKYCTDKAVLKLVKEQRNIWANDYINRLERWSKPAKAISSYGDLWKLTYKNSGRVIECMSPWQTETGRFNSKKSQFWCGTNGQNMPPGLREMYVADPDYVFLDADYKASDDWWVAFESQDPAKMDVCLTGKDAHCFHASMFYGIDYEKILAGKKEDADWVIRKPDGVREVAKHIGHGKNYMAQAETIYDQMGRDATVKAAQTMGHANASGWTDKQLIEFIDSLCRKYDDPHTGIYKRLRPWQREIAIALANNKGRCTNIFGFTRQFFGSASDAATQRELCAFYGQGDTAGNINRALFEIFYNGIDDRRLCLFVKQGHDSLTFLVHRSVLSTKAAEIKGAMERASILHGRTVSIPVDMEVGLTWGKKMLKWRPDVTYEEILAFEHKAFDKKYPSIAAQIQQESQEEAAISDALLSAFDDFADTAELSAQDLAEADAEQDAELDDITLERDIHDDDGHSGQRAVC